jgi:hypothetical protein
MIHPEIMSPIRTVPFDSVHGGQEKASLLIKVGQMNQ